MSTSERRKAAIGEMLRILKQGGLGLIYVWAKEQEEKKFDEQDVFVPWKSNVKGGDTFQRYYHVFVEGELEDLVKDVQVAGFRFEVRRNYYDRSNWAVVLEKVKIDN